MAKTKTASWEDDITADEVVVSVCLNRRLFRAYVEAREAADRGGGDDDAEVKELLQAVVDAKQAVDEASKQFTFATVDYDRWQKLLEDHPPTDAQRDDNRYLDYNPDTFPPVAVQAACVEPELSPKQVGLLQQKLPRDEWRRLWEAAWTANVGGSSIPKQEAAIVARLSSELNSITRPPTGSRSPSSEGDG